MPIPIANMYPMFSSSSKKIKNIDANFINHNMKNILVNDHYFHAIKRCEFASRLRDEKKKSVVSGFLLDIARLTIACHGD